MTNRRIHIATALFVLGIFLAGFANAMSKLVNIKYNESQGAFTAAPFLSTVLFSMNLFIYLFLLIFWILSVQSRLTRKSERSCMIAAALCAVAMLILRSIKYRLIDQSALDATRYIWYLYYVPMILLPTLFLMTCIRIQSKGRATGADERLLLIPSSIMILLFMTNDLHHLAFRPVGGIVMTGANGSYANNTLFYLYYAYYGVTIVAGLVLLVRANRRLHSIRKTLLPFAFLLAMLGLALVDKALSLVRLPSMFAVPEIVAFGMIGLFESCLRNRLFPYNENYVQFFEQMCFPAIITDKALRPAYRSVERIDEAWLAEALSGPVYPDEDIRLSAREITAGYTFYTEDESELHRLNTELKEANELIAGENDLIQAENELTAKQAQVESRNLIYTRISEKMLPYHRRALDMIDDIDADDPEFDQKIAGLNLLNAYIKRGTNLLLVDEGNDMIAAGELSLALDELARYLGYFGVKTIIRVIDKALPRDEALALLTSVYEVVSSLSDEATMLNVVVDGGSLRMTCDAPCNAKAPLGVTARENGGLYFYSRNVREGGAI